MSEDIARFAGTTECIDSAVTSADVGLILQTSIVGPPFMRRLPVPIKHNIPRLLAAKSATFAEVRGRIVKNFDIGTTFIMEKVDVEKAYRGCVIYSSHTSVAFAVLSIAFFSAE